MGFAHFLKGFTGYLTSLFTPFPTTLQQAADHPYPLLAVIFVLLLILRGSFMRAFIFVLAALIFLAGLYYNTIESDMPGQIRVVVFAAAALVSLTLILYQFFIKSEH